MKNINFYKFKNESYYQRLKAMAGESPREQLVYVFFGGTGAVGGQSAIEIIQSFEFIVSVKPEWTAAKPLLLITGINREEIERFRSKLYKTFESGSGHSFEHIEDDDKKVLTLKRRSGITIEMHELLAVPQFNANLRELVSGKSSEEITQILQRESSNISAPFLTFLSEYLEAKNFPQNFRVQAVISGIPIPSVAAYHFSEIDNLLTETGIRKNDTDRSIERQIKTNILHGIANDFGMIKQQLANEVIIAHTTAVGGMFTIEGEKPVIRLGYAHSALDEALLEKQFFANELTRKYSELDLKILITAAAIGVDYIFSNYQLPVNAGIFRKFKLAAEDKKLPFPEKLLDRKHNYIFPPVLLGPYYPIVNSKGEPELQTQISFWSDDKNPPAKFKTEYGLRSGENGVFSLDNVYALYLNMKIATQEELAHILSFNALFGDDKQKPWFDEYGICYQTETENATLVFALLNNRSEFRSYQTSGFTLKAFQDLGSAKHQSELHTIGLYQLLHRLKNLNPRLISEKITSKYTEPEVMEFVDRNTEPLCIEDVVKQDTSKLASDFAILLTLKSHQELAIFVGFHGDLHSKFVHAFFQHLFTAIKQTICSITSLGSPIVFEQAGQLKVLVGPYCAPIDSVITHNDTLAKYIKDDALACKLKPTDYFEWIVANNGFVDLRPQATIVTAKTHKGGLKGKVRIIKNLQDFHERIEEIQEENTRQLSLGYFTSSGVVAFTGRMIGLYEQLKRFDISLGTLNNWKSLFPVDSNRHHVVVPGIIEAMRMYCEGLGKVTGFELLYPGFGYYKK